MVWKWLELMLQEVEGSAQVEDVFFNTSAHVVTEISHNRQELGCVVDNGVGQQMTLSVIS